ncbi:MAG TPA: DUF4365 domain-containing protein [Pirellulales bacterium]|nr:DUF4365 domain-containing protein [Pirellulales bacterium]
MAKRRPAEARKQRTREHVIADQSVNYVERFVLCEGHTVQRQEHDYGYDLNVITYDGDGYVEPGSFYLQVKAAENLNEIGTDFVFDLDVRDYNLWMRELMPVILVLFHAARGRAYWLYVQRYFRQDHARQPKQGTKTVRVRVPKRQAVNRRAVAAMRAIKQDMLTRLKGLVDVD